MENNIKNMLQQCFALTGGIATGKSTVASMLEKKGAHIIDTDLIAREIVEPGKPALDAIISEFGDLVLLENGTLNRDAMREEIIKHPDKREKLNEITHPEINKVVFSRISNFYNSKDLQPIIIDVPLLFEVGWNKLFDTIILVYVPVAIQVNRLMQRDDLDESTARLTLKAQMGIDEKKDKSTFVIDNSGTTEETLVSVNNLYEKLYEEIKGRTVRSK